MNYLYTITYLSKIKKILKEGIKPQKEETYYGDEKRNRRALETRKKYGFPELRRQVGVYAHTNLKSVKNYLEEIISCRDNAVIIKFIKSGVWKKDSHVDNPGTWVYSKKAIKPSEIVGLAYAQGQRVTNQDSRIKRCKKPVKPNLKFR